MRGVFKAIIGCLIVAIAAGIWLASFQYFRSEEVETASARLSLYRSTTLAELERFSHLTFVLSRDPRVVETARGGVTEALNQRLAAFAERAGIDAIYLMQLDGITIAASNAATPQSFVGQDYSFRPYFKTAMAGRQGQFYGIGATTGLPGYFYAEAVTDNAGRSLGVIAIKIDLASLQTSWQESGERVLLTNGDGVVLLSSEPRWRYRTLMPLSDLQRDRIAAARQFPGQPLAPLDWQPGENQSAVIDGRRLLHLVAADLPNDWNLHYFAPPDRAEIRAWLVTGSVLLLLGAALIIVQVQRGRRMRSALFRSEKEEAALREANDRLAVEIEERRLAQTQLQKTQDELQRAGRLAALGQLSASVTHELGQPIAAMKNHLAVAELQGQATPFTGKLQALVDRMEGITRQLKFFARTGRDDMEQVDLVSAMQAALELIQPNLDVSGIKVDFRAEEGPVLIQANRLRIEQVMTNLLRNAADAMEETAEPKVEIQIFETGFSVSDNGHGLGDRALDELIEPFATTRESGQGMGLGLTISAGIVAEHGGQISASDRLGGGTEMRVTFPSTKLGQAA